MQYCVSIFRFVFSTEILQNEKLHIMGVMSIRVDDEMKKKLKAIASLQGKTMSSIVEGLIERYIEDVKSEIEWDDESKAIE